MDWNAAIVSGFRAGIVAIRPDGVVAFVNAIGSRILGGSPLAVGENIKDRAGENPFFWMLSEAISLDYLSPRVETYLADENGEPMRIGFTLAAIPAGDGKGGICAFFKDLRHVEIAEENEQTRQRLLLLERVGAGIVGEIAGPVAELADACSALRGQAAREGLALPPLAALGDTVLRLETVVRECRGFIEPVSPGPGKVAVDDLVEGIVAALAAAHPAIEFTVHRPAGIDYTVEADPALLGKALSIVAAAAVDGSGGRGALEIALSRAGHFIDVVRLDREARCVLPPPTGKEEEYLRISIRNGRPGGARELRKRVFVPFDRQGRPGAGTGLPVAQKIVAAHGGILEAAEDEGRDVEFRVMVPVRQKGARA